MPLYRGSRYALLDRPVSGNLFLLLDLFANDELAPIASPHAAVPGPGSALRVDPADKISVVSDWLVFASGAAWAHLVYSTPALIRAAGLIVGCKYKPTTPGRHYPLALMTTTTPSWDHTGVEHGFFQSVEGYLHCVNAEALDNVALVVSAGTEYWLILAPLATGCRYFAKGGLYTAWTEVGTELAVGTTGTLYVGAANYDADMSIGSLAVPKALYTGDLV